MWQKERGLQSRRLTLHLRSNFVAMFCPAPVQKAMERIQLGIPAASDEQLVSAWLDWCVQQTDAEDKEECLECPPMKRLRRQASVSLLCTAR